MDDSDKARRLAAALRQNLKRRKAQTRAAAEQPGPTPPAPSRGKLDGEP